jgi:hypothetical protein
MDAHSMLDMVNAALHTDGDVQRLLSAGEHAQPALRLLDDADHAVQRAALLAIWASAPAPAADADEAAVRAAVALAISRGDSSSDGILAAALDARMRGRLGDLAAVSMVRRLLVPSALAYDELCAFADAVLGALDAATSDICYARSEGGARLVIDPLAALVRPADADLVRAALVGVYVYCPAVRPLYARPGPLGAVDDEFLVNAYALYQRYVCGSNALGARALLRSLAEILDYMDVR